MQELGQYMPRALIGSLAPAPVGEVSVGVLQLGHSHLYVLPFVGLYSARACYWFLSTYALILNPLFFGRAGLSKIKENTWYKEDISVLYGEVW